MNFDVSRIDDNSQFGIALSEFDERYFNKTATLEIRSQLSR